MADTNHLAKILEKTVSPDTAELEGAQKYLEQAALENLPQFLLGLSQVLSNSDNTQVVRIAAGLQLKNYLTSKDANIRLQCQKRWIQVSEDVKQSVKNLVLNTLGTEASGHSTAAQCIACIACAELPHGQWPQLIEILVANVTGATSTASTKESTLEAIGYICQDIEPHHLAGNSNEILTAIMQGMRKEELSIPVKLAATTALLNSLEFTKANFDTTNERHYIMAQVCEATQCTDTHVKVAALQCLVKILSLYYKYMEDYMKAALFAITIEAMKSDVDDIALQGIEFWSNVCDEEMDLAIEATEAMEQSRRPENYSRFYAKGALEFLVPILMKMLTKQDENDDEDDWNPCKSAGVCMMLLANCCENDVVQYVMPFVEGNIKNCDWRYRDASVMAFGSILEGPDPNQLKTIVIQAMPFLIELMGDPSVIVRDTVAWTIGRVCELLPEAVVNQVYFAQLLEVLLKGLEAEPRVAANICWAFSSLAEAAYEQASMAVEEDEEPETYQLSSNFSLIVSKLLLTTNREDAHQANLRNAAYEALMEMVKNSAKDCYKAVQDTTIVIMERIRQILTMESHFQTASDRMQYHDLQSLLCATLQSVLRKFQPEDAKMIADPVMNSLIHMLESTSGKSGGVQEDALLAVGTLIEVLNIEFNKYMERFVVHLIRSLANTAEYQVCLAAVGLVGDICRALNAQILPICDEIMKLLLENLSDKSVHRSVKPQILSVFGDIALAIGSQFQKYLQIVLSALNQASQAQVDKTDYDMVEYLNELREGCLEAYTGIIQGLKGEENNEESKARLDHVWPHVEHMVNFIEYIAKDEDHTDSNASCCAGLIGDLCSAFGPNMLQYLETKEDIHELLQEGRRSKTSKTKMLATWATKELRKLKQI